MNQKRRTRHAIKQAAAELVQGGAAPSIAEVAEVAGVSKSTAYRYFPSQEALLAETLLDAAVAPGLVELDKVAARGTPAERVRAVVRADHRLVTENEARFRAGLRAMLVPREDAATETPRRPANRLRYLGIAVSDLAEALGPERLNRLIAALALCVGIESVVVTSDVCGLDAKTAQTVKQWAAAALLEASLREIPAL